MHSEIFDTLDQINFTVYCGAVSTEVETKVVNFRITFIF